MQKSIIAMTLTLLFPALAAAGPDLKPGDRFVYEGRTRTFAQTYEGAGPGSGHTFSLENGDRLRFSASLSLVARPGTQVDPHNAQLVLDPRAGFALGEAWETSYQIIRDNGRTSDKTRACTVAAHEPALVVRAGIFDAYRVDCVIETVGDETRYGQSWYDARTWRVLEHNVGVDADDLQTVLELIEIDLKPR